MENNHNWKRRLIAQIPWLIAGILLCWPAFYNGFPLVYSDSGTYINSSFELLPPPDRPIGYGYFIHIVTWKASLWPIVIAQGLLLSALIRQVLRIMLPNAKPIVFGVIMAILTIFSSLPWFVSQIMPDVFAAVLILGMALMVFAEKNRAVFIFGTLAVFLGCIVHTGFIFLALVLGILLSLVYFIRLPFRSFLRKSGMLFLPIFVAIMFIMTNQAINGHGFRLSRTGNLFLLGRLADAELLEPFMAQQCATNKYTFCEDEWTRSAVLDDILWNPNTSVVQKYGAWEKADSTVAAVISDFFSKPKNQLDFALSGIKNGFKQLQMVAIGDGIGPQGWEDAPSIAIRWRIPRHIDAFFAARQQKGTLMIPFLQNVQKPIMYVSFGLLCLILLITWKSSKMLRNVSIFLIISLIMHAFVNATLAAAVDRYQARISWIVFFVALVLVGELLSSRFLSKKSI